MPLGYLWRNVYLGFLPVKTLYVFLGSGGSSLLFAQVFSSHSERGVLSIAVGSLLDSVASLSVEHGL